MRGNAAVVRVSALEARDQSEQDWAPDQSCWQTQQHCCSATVSLPLSSSSISAEARAIFSPGPSLPTTTTHLSPLLSVHPPDLSLHPNLTHCTPWTIHCDSSTRLLSFHPHSWTLLLSWGGKEGVLVNWGYVSGGGAPPQSCPRSSSKDLSCVLAGLFHVCCQCEFRSYCFLGELLEIDPSWWLNVWLALEASQDLCSGM